MKQGHFIKKVFNPQIINLLAKYKNVVFISLLITFFILLGCSTNSKSGSYSLAGSREIINAGHYATIQNAINALPEEGGIVVLPPGEFKITEPLVINIGDVSLKGSGTATHIINQNSSHLPAIQLSSDTSLESADNEPLWRIQISDLRITGNPDSGDGILAENINEIYLEGITVSENGGNGITLDNCYEDPRIVHSVITYNKETGLNLLACHDIVVNGNQFEENNDALHCFDSYNLTMSGNNLDDHLNHGVVIENTYGSVVSGNMIEECRGIAIVLDRDCYGIDIGSNVIAHNGGGVTLNDAHGIAVSANTFTIDKVSAVYCSSECARITISGNNFSDSYIGEGDVKRSPNDIVAAGVTLDGSRDILLSGNVFSGIHPDKALTMKKPGKNILFENNILIDAPSDHNKLQNSLVNNNLVVSE